MAVNDVHSVGSDARIVQTHSTPLGFEVVNTLVGVHHDIPLRVPSRACLLARDIVAFSPLAMARLVLCRHRIVPAEHTSLRRTHYDRPTLAKPLPRLFGVGFTCEHFPYVVVRLVYSRTARRLTSLHRCRENKQYVFKRVIKSSRLVQHNKASGQV